MLHHRPRTSTLRIACCPGSLGGPFTQALAVHRAEEPETWPDLIETGFLEQASGLEQGRYDLGLSLEESASAAMASVPLWHDEIAMALPRGSPLLALEAIPLDELVRHPLVLWSPTSPETLAMRTNALLCEARRPLDMVQHVETFAMLATMVGAGHGAALAGKARIADWGDRAIAMWPLAGPPRVLTTWLLHPAEGSSGVVERFVERACRSLKPSPPSP